MANVFNNIFPVQAAFHLKPFNNISTPPVNAPNPNWQLAPGATPQLPQRAIAQKPPGNLKSKISALPSLFDLINNANSGQ